MPRGHYTRSHTPRRVYTPEHCADRKGFKALKKRLERLEEELEILQQLNAEAVEEFNDSKKTKRRRISKKAARPRLLKGSGGGLKGS